MQLLCLKSWETLLLYRHFWIWIFQVHSLKKESCQYIELSPLNRRIEKKKKPQIYAQIVDKSVLAEVRTQQQEFTVPLKIKIRTPEEPSLAISNCADILLILWKLGELWIQERWFSLCNFLLRKLSPSYLCAVFLFPPFMTCLWVRVAQVPVNTSLGWIRVKQNWVTRVCVWGRFILKQFTVQWKEGMWAFWFLSVSV